MLTTQLTLLHRASQNEPEAWELLDGIYRPFVNSWFCSRIMNLVDADDLTQEVMSAAFRELPQFAHSGRYGAFRKWLTTICLNRLLGYRRNLKNHRGLFDDSGIAGEANTIARVSELEEWLNQEHDAAVLRFLFRRVEAYFEPATIAVFRRLMVDEIPPSDVAAEFSTTIGAIYVARSRVLRKLREESESLFGNDSECLWSSTPNDKSREQHSSKTV